MCFNHSEAYFRQRTYFIFFDIVTVSVETTPIPVDCIEKNVRHNTTFKIYDF